MSSNRFQAAESKSVIWLLTGRVYLFLAGDYREAVGKVPFQVHVSPLTRSPFVAYMRGGSRIFGTSMNDFSSSFHLYQTNEGGCAKASPFRILLSELAKGL